MHSYFAYFIFLFAPDPHVGYVHVQKTTPATNVVRTSAPACSSPKKCPGSFRARPVSTRGGFGPRK